MEMIAHEAKGVHLPVGLGAGLTERGEKALAVFIIKEDRLAAVAAIHDVVDRPLVFNAQFSSHVAKLWQGVLIVKN
jgi:hypothetical protein